MTILAFDTATASSAVALRLADGSTSEARDDPPPGAHPGHATRLLEMARTLLEQAGLGWSDLDRIAAGVGPGTFTGLRVGVATARGLAQSLGIELVGVSSLQALAHGALAPGAALERPRDRVLAVIDARRGEAFLAAYARGEAAAPRQLSEPRALAPADLSSAIEGAEADGAGWLAVGDGAVRFRAALESAGAEVPDDASPLHRVSAASICTLAGAAPAAGRELLPDYRRRPDAELALEGAGKLP
jgi:tRNA threonylcarbamoyladenosine biosynthesis protein TsaB